MTAKKKGDTAQPMEEKKQQTAKPFVKRYVRLKSGEEYEIERADGVYLYCNGTQIRHTNPGIGAVYEKKEG